ncbi:hypothetical protein TNCV_4827551 [Trichonephila clavipes]|uniref:Uncharacterized protein n=1 Tax=Trichonephila clavipes TaxID=2585209 RepID=A0A8X6SLW0_TRICX|nr:hypothetical protein TNCV_4827551 [Trichonephila clavipes]
MRGSRQHFYAKRHSSSLVVVGVQQTIQQGCCIVILYQGGKKGSDSILFLEGMKPVETVRRMQAQSGDSCLSRSNLYELI